MFCFSYATVWVWLKSKGGVEKINLYTDPTKKEVGVDWKDLRGRKEGNYKTNKVAVRSGVGQMHHISAALNGP